MNESNPLDKRKVGCKREILHHVEMYPVHPNETNPLDKRKEVDDLWNSLLEFEGDIIREFAEPNRVHG